MAKRYNKYNIEYVGNKTVITVYWDSYICQYIVYPKGNSYVMHVKHGDSLKSLKSFDYNDWEYISRKEAIRAVWEDIRETIYNFF